MAAPVQEIVRAGGGVPSDLLDWMISQGLLGTKAEDVFEGFATRLVAYGLPINRAYSAMRILHPLYLGFFLAFWATPHMSYGHLLLSAGMSVFMLIAIRYEERDLVTLFGVQYVEYRARVGMLIPGIGRRR